MMNSFFPLLVGVIVANGTLLFHARRTRSVAREPRRVPRPFEDPFDFDVGRPGLDDNRRSLICVYLTAYEAGLEEAILSAAVSLLPPGVRAVHAANVRAMFAARAAFAERAFAKCRSLYAGVRDSFLPAQLRYDFRQELSEVCGVLKCLRAFVSSCEPNRASARRACDVASREEFLTCLVAECDEALYPERVLAVLESLKAPSADERVMYAWALERCGRSDDAARHYHFAANLNRGSLGSFARSRALTLVRAGFRFTPRAGERFSDAVAAAGR